MTDVPPPDTQILRRFRHPGWAWASAIFLALILAAGTWVVVSDDRDRTDVQTQPATRSAPSSPPSAPTSARPAVGDSCPELAAENQAAPVSAPRAEWRLVGRVQAPVSVDHGPVFDADEMARCYSRTPTGALLAAVNFLALTTDPIEVDTAIGVLTADTLGRGVLLDLLEQNPTAVTGTGTTFQIAGFTFLTIGMDTTAVSVVIRADNGGMAAVPVTLVWADDTWLVQLPDDGNIAGRASQVGSLTGFTPFFAP
jgi:hypothetical protein